MKSKKPKKQRKRKFTAKLHEKRKQLSAGLSKELRKELKRRSLPVRAKDFVKVLRGVKKGFKGKVSRIDRKKVIVFIEGLTRKKTDGTEIAIPVHPSNLLITDIDRSDERRIKRKK